MDTPLGATVVAFVLGAALSFVGSMPVAGPIAVIVLERGLVARAGEGMRIALGSAIAESGYAALAYWGVGAALERLPGARAASRMLGGVIFVVLGAYLARRGRGAAGGVEVRGGDPPAGDAARAAGGRRGLALGFAITALNPTLVATWTATVTAMHAVGVVRPSGVAAAAFALGVGAGVVGWFAVLLRLVARARRRLSPQTTLRLVRAAGWLLLAVGGGLVAAEIVRLVRA